jgi:hypothetical protein
MAQAAVSDGQVLDLVPRLEDGLAAVEVDVGGSQVAEALVVATVVVVIDEGGDGGLELAGEEVVFQQDAVLQGLVPALDLALGLGVVRRSADVGDALALEPPGEVASDVGRAIVAEQPGSMEDLRGIAARGAKANSSVSVTSPARMVTQSFQATM